MNTELAPTLVNVALIIVILVDSWLLWFLLKSPRRTVAHRFLELHVIGVLLWTINILLLLQFPASNIVGGTTFAAALLFAIAKYYFALTFPKNSLSMYSWHIIVLPPVCLLLAAASYVPGVVFSDMQVVKGYYFTLENGPAGGAYSLVVTYFLLYPIFHLRRKYRLATDYKLKEQLRFLTYGMALFFVLALITNSILPVFFGIYIFNSLGPILSVFLAGFIVYIISKHEFLDVRLVIQRGLIYFAILSCIVGIYAATLGVSGFLFSPQSIMAQYISAVLAIIVSVLTVPKIDQSLRRMTDNWFFVDRYRYQTALSELSSILQSSLHMDTLLSTCEDKLKELLRVTEVSISQEELTDTEVATLSIPIKLQDNLIGCINLSEKKSGLAYTTEDLELLETFATQAATAISRVFLYQEIKQKAEELERKVAERTTELATAYEDQTQLMLHISHNLQTPLAILRTKIETLDATTVDTESFTQTLDQVSVFIQQLLRLARLEHTDDTVEMTDTDMSALLLEITDEASVIAEMSDITITHEIADDLRCVTNTQQVREIVMNLLSNAIKYIGEEDPKTVTVTAGVVGSEIEVTVADTGIGINADALKSVFERFHRNETTKAIAGTGLGLAITKQLVEQIGGTISVTSTLGEGSAFTIRLPR